MTQKLPLQGADAIAHAVINLETQILQLARQTGARLEFTLSDPAHDAANSGDLVVRYMTEGLERILVERAGGEWMLVHAHTILVGGTQRRLLRDAPLKTRALFLERANEFVDAYLAAVDEMRQLQEADARRTATLVQNANRALAKIMPIGRPKRRSAIKVEYKDDDLDLTGV